MAGQLAGEDKMAMFKKQEPVMSAPQQNGSNRSRFQLILDDLNAANKRLDHAAHLFSTLIHDIERGMTFIDRFRKDLTEAIEETGGTVIDTNIEEQMAAFIPKNYVRPVEETGEQ
jgi:hypothetical protein